MTGIKRLILLRHSSFSSCNWREHSLNKSLPHFSQYVSALGSQYSFMMAIWFSDIKALPESIPDFSSVWQLEHWLNSVITFNKNKVKSTD
jgi:hypothetical protein